MTNYSALHYSEKARKYAEEAQRLADASGYAKKTDVPTKTSQLTNDSDFATNASVNAIKVGSDLSYEDSKLQLIDQDGKPIGSAVEIKDGDKLDTNLGNATAQTKETVVGWGMPDFSSGVSKTKGVIYQAEHDGFVYIKSKQTNTDKASLVLEIGFEPDLSDAFNIAQFYTSPNTTFESSSFTPIPKGTYYRAKENSYATTITFYPLKGA